MTDGQAFLLQRVQPALTGLIDGSLSTIAPIFSVAIYTHEPHAAFIAGTATAIAAGISMAYSEGLSDTGEMTGRGHPAVRGAITGAGTFLGGILHTLPFLIPHYHAALVAASIVVACELVALAWIRYRFLETSFLVSVAHITLGGAVIVAVSVALGTTAPPWACGRPCGRAAAGRRSRPRGGGSRRARGRRSGRASSATCSTRR